MASLQEEEDSEDEAYKRNLRDMQGDFREYAPLMNRVAAELNRNIFDGSNALSSDPETVEGDNKLREATKKIINRCRKLAGMLGCAASVDVHVPPPGGSTRALASSSHTSEGSSSHAASPSRLVNDTEEEEEVDEEEGGDDEEGDEEEYDDDDGPQPTQPTQAKRVSHPHQDVLSPSAFQKPVPRRCSKKPDEGRSKTNEDRAAKRGRGTN
nr:uncharacterized protein LOC109783247 [Aegilops tauschii subsp. strangulata]